MPVDLCAGMPVDCLLVHGFVPVEAGGTYNDKNKAGKTAPHDASSVGYKAMAKVLINEEAGALYAWLVDRL